MYKKWFFIWMLMIPAIAFSTVENARSQDEASEVSATAQPQVLNSSGAGNSYTILYEDAKKLIEKREKETGKSLSSAQKKKSNNMAQGGGRSLSNRENTKTENTGTRRIITVDQPEVVNNTNSFLFNDVTER